MADREDRGAVPDHEPGAGDGTAPDTDWHFCTFFDSGYLPAGMALYESMADRLASLNLWVLCLDDAAHEVLQCLDPPGLHPVELGTLESFDEELAAVRDDRTAPEYYFTCKSAFVDYLFERADPLGVAYLDADLYFFRSPVELRLADREASAVVHAHNFPADRAGNAERVGRYNAGFVAVRNDPTGRRCIADWRERCLDWCYDRVEDGRYADQKYLDDWPDRFGADVIDRPGVGTARWNLPRWSVSREDGSVLVDGDPLVFYHFEALQQLTRRVWNPHADLPAVVEDHVYRPYVRHRTRIGERVEARTGHEIDDRTYRLGLVARGHGPVGNAARTLYRVADTIRAGVTGELLYVPAPEGPAETGTDAD